MNVNLHLHHVLSNCFAITDFVNMVTYLYLLNDEFNYVPQYIGWAKVFTEPTMRQFDSHLSDYVLSVNMLAFRNFVNSVLFMQNPCVTSLSELTAILNSTYTVCLSKNQ